MVSSIPILGKNNMGDTSLSAPVLYEDEELLYKCRYGGIKKGHYLAGDGVKPIRQIYPDIGNFYLTTKRVTFYHYDETKWYKWLHDNISAFGDNTTDDLFVLMSRDGNQSTFTFTLRDHKYQVIKLLREFPFYKQNVKYMHTRDI